MAFPVGGPAIRFENLTSKLWETFKKKTTNPFTIKINRCTLIWENSTNKPYINLVRHRGDSFLSTLFNYDWVKYLICGSIPFPWHTYQMAMLKLFLWGWLMRLMIFASLLISIDKEGTRTKNEINYTCFSSNYFENWNKPLLFLLKEFYCPFSLMHFEVAFNAPFCTCFLLHWLVFPDPWVAQADDHITGHPWGLSYISH